MNENQPQYSEAEVAEAVKFNAMVEEGKLTPAEASQIEKDKTPEEVEAEKEAMEKVMDIFKAGTAIHGISSSIFSFQHAERLKKILEEGISVPSSKFSFFNISGRSSKANNIEYGDKIIFDISNLEEIAPWRSSGVNLDELQEGKFTSNSSVGSLNSEADYGFVTRGSISSERFKGLVLVSSDEYKVNPSEVDPNLPKFKEGMAISGDANTRFAQLIDLLAVPTMRSAYKERNDLFIPIYDGSGNLCWPKRMTHEQVKQFVEERGEKKSTKEKNESE